MGRTVRKPGPAGGIKRLTAAVAELSEHTGKVGYFETSRYPDGTPVAYVAAIQEFGTTQAGKNKDVVIPPRPTLRPAVEKNSQAWAESFGKGVKAIAAGRFTGTQVLDAVGQLAAADIRKEIAELKSPPLDPDTIAARKRRYANKKRTGNLSKPLVDTAVMVNAVTNTVEPK